MRSIAEVAQRVLLRPEPRTAGPLQAAVSYTSAVAEARIGGDLYEMVASPHGIRVIVGDVQGKGLAAVETAAVVLGAFREAAHDEPDLVGLGERLERSVARELEGERFVTAVLAEIGERDEVVFLDYGHPAPMVVRHNGDVDFPRPIYPLGDRADLLKEPDAERALEALREDLVRHASGPLHDDAATLLLRYHGHGEGKSVPIG